MSKKLLTLLTISLLLILSVAGCQHGDFKISPIVAGQEAPHSGYNIGPELYLRMGDRAIVDGAVIYIKGIEPFDLENMQEGQ